MKLDLCRPIVVLAGTEPPPGGSGEGGDNHDCGDEDGQPREPWFFLRRQLYRCGLTGAIDVRASRNGRERVDESVSAARQRFHKPRRLCGIRQGRPQLGDSHVHGVVKVPIRFVRPNAVLQVLASDNRTGFLQQRRQDLQRLILEADACSRFAQLARGHVDLEDTESFRAIGRMRFHRAPFENESR